MDQLQVSHIESSPEKCGGRPCIIGTRIRVLDIYVWHEMQGKSPDEIVAQTDGISLSDVHAALAYCFDHLAEIRDDLATEKVASFRQMLTAPSKLQRL
jgi:uncharacterized protein (DUF433 family)